MIRSEQKGYFFSVFIIFSIALICRLLFDAYLQKYYIFYDFPSTDVSYYKNWAKDIAQFSLASKQTFFGLPLYPYFLAGLYRLCLGNEQLIRFAHLTIGSINCCLIYWMTALVFSQRIAIVAGLLCALSFSGIYYDWLMMPPPLLILIAAILIILLIKQDQLRSKRHWLYLGLLVGLGVLGDGKFLFFVILFCIYQLFKHKHHWRATTLNMLAPLMIGVFIVLACVGLRNKIVGGEWIWISAQSGLNLYYGNNPDAKGYFESPDLFRPTHAGQDVDQILTAQHEAGRTLGVRSVSRFYRSKAVDFIINHPGLWVKLLVKKMHLFLIESEYTFDMDLIFLNFLKYRLDVNPYTLVLPLALLGMFLARKQKGVINLYLIILAQLIFVLVFYLLNRYRATILPFFVIFESVALVWLVDQMRRKRITQIVLTFGFMVSFMYFFQPQFLQTPVREHLTYSKLGFVLEQRGAFNQAQDAYLKALTLRPTDASLIYNLGNISVQKGDLKSARELYEQVLDINPLNVDAYFNLGIVHEKTRQLELAKKAYHRVLTLTPQSVDAAYRLGMIHIEEGRCAKAQYHFNRIIQSNPQHRFELNKALASCNINN